RARARIAIPADAPDRAARCPTHLPAALATGSRQLRSRQWLACAWFQSPVCVTAAVAHSIRPDALEYLWLKSRTASVFYSGTHVRTIRNTGGSYFDRNE